MYKFFIEKNCNIYNKGRLLVVRIEIFESSNSKLFLEKLRESSESTFKNQISLPKIFIRYKEKWIKLEVEGNLCRSVFLKDPKINIRGLYYYERDLK